MNFISTSVSAKKVSFLMYMYSREDAHTNNVFFNGSTTKGRIGYPPPLDCI